MSTHSLDLLSSKTAAGLLPVKLKSCGNFSPRKQMVFEEWKQKIDAIFRLHGFNRINPPAYINRAFIIENENGESQDFIPQGYREDSQKTFGVIYNRSKSYGLWLHHYHKEIRFPYKTFDIISLYSSNTRYQSPLGERACLEFDVAGRELSLISEAACMTTMIEALDKIKSHAFVVYVNHAEIPKKLVEFVGFYDPIQTLRILEKIHSIQSEVIINELESLNPDISVDQITKLVKLLSFKGSIESFLESFSEPSIIDFVDQVKQVLLFTKMSGLTPQQVQFAPGIVKDIHKYTGICFQAYYQESPELGCVALGGRNHQVITSTSTKLKDLQSVSGFINLSKIFQLEFKKKKIRKDVQISAKVLLLVADRGLLPQAFEVALLLRQEGVSADLYSGEEKSLKKQLRYASKAGFPVGVIVNDAGHYLVRDLTAGQQTNPIQSSKTAAKRTLSILNHRTLWNLSIYTFGKESKIDIGRHRVMTIEDFNALVRGEQHLALNSETIERLNKTRSFIDYLLSQNIKVYGITTGFADLRNKTVRPDQASELSRNLIISHDAGIGALLSKEIVRGAMVVRANSLAKGYSGFRVESLNTLIEMINAQITPEIPETGSLGASGDLALLARLGHAMMGSDRVWVDYQGVRMTSKDALEKAGIAPFVPAAKEGLALTNGTSFMSAALSLAYLKQLELYETILALMNVYLSATRSIDAAFNASIQDVRKQKGQSLVAELLRHSLEGSPLIDRKEVQNDYSQRCLPAIFGPKIEDFLTLRDQVFNEMDAVTDNPLIFHQDEISADVAQGRRIEFNGEEWAVLSGGNFHGEVIATTADILVTLSSKIALTMERQLTFINNPARNKQLFPTYLINDEQNAGLRSGFMILQYTGNGLTQKICALANPVTNFNITSANESEDLVSYGNAAVEKLLKQLEYLEQLTQVYATAIFQAYAITRTQFLREGSSLDASLISEQIFVEAHKKVQFPLLEETSFETIYGQMGELIKSSVLRKILGYPLLRELEQSL